MSKPESSGNRPSADDSVKAKVSASPVQQLPLAVRMTLYAIIFLGIVLAVLPWLFYRIDVLIPAIHVELATPIRMLGGALFVASLSMYLLSSYVLTNRGKGAFVEFDPPTELVVTGPYRYSRNPVVIFLLASMLGLALAFSSTGILLMFVIFTGLVNHQVQRIEEPLLRERYGDAYDRYCAEVPRWFPRLRPWTP